MHARDTLPSRECPPSSPPGLTRWSMLTGKVQLGPISALQSPMDRRVIGERSDAVLRTAMPGDDELFRCRDAPSHPSCATPRKAKPRKHSQEASSPKRREAGRREAHQPGAASTSDAARALSSVFPLREDRGQGLYRALDLKKWSGRARLSAPHRGIRGFCPRLGPGRASWNHRMQTGGPSPAPVQRAPRSPTRAGRDDAQAARERSVWPRSREPLPLRP
jgi:hypothetical protein